MKAESPGPKWISERLVAVLDSMEREVKPQTLGLLAAMLAGYDKRTLEAALVRCLREGGWKRGTPLLAWIESKMQNSPDEVMAQARADIEKLVRHPHWTPKHCTTDPAINAAVEDLGGFEHIKDLGGFELSDIWRRFAVLYPLKCRELAGKPWAISSPNMQARTYCGRLQTEGMGEFRTLPEPKAAAEAPKSKPRSFGDMQQEQVDEETARMRKIAGNQSDPRNAFLLDLAWAQQMGREEEFRRLRAADFVRFGYAAPEPRPEPPDYKARAAGEGDDR